MYYCQDANIYEKVTSVISWNCPVQYMVCSRDPNYDCKMVESCCHVIADFKSCSQISNYDCNLFKVTVIIQNFMIAFS